MVNEDNFFQNNIEYFQRTIYITFNAFSWEAEKGVANGFSIVKEYGRQEVRSI